MYYKTQMLFKQKENFSCRTCNLTESWGIRKISALTRLAQCSAQRKYLNNTFSNPFSDFLCIPSSFSSHLIWLIWIGINIFCSPKPYSHDAQRLYNITWKIKICFFPTLVMCFRSLLLMLMFKLLGTHFVE